ncbi:MAG: uroporphyrinogen decarboxylase family protein [Spirochaetota bacterium]
MNSKDRVLAVLHHQEPDRVPLALWGSYYTLNDQTYFNILDYLKIGKPVKPFRKQKPRNSNYYDDRVMDILGTDIRYIWSGFTDLGGARMEIDGKDAWGVKWQRKGDTVVCIEAPLSGLSIEEIEDYTWPDPEKYIDFELIKERLHFLEKTYPMHAIGARAVNSYGPFEQAAELRGRENFYMDLITQPDLARLIIQKCTDVIVKTQEIYLELVSKKVDFFEIPGDDYGGTHDVMISPDLFNDLFKPALKSIVECVKRFEPHLPVVFHSDGAITKIIPGLIEAGVDVLNPLEPLPAVDWEDVKKEYTGRLCFMGGVDLKKALRGSIEDVEEDVKRCIRTFGSRGEYILGPANHIPPDVPPQNIVAMYEAGKKYGVYPLKL